MPLTFLQSIRHRWLRRWMAWVLVCALPMQSLSGVLLNLTGAQHRHRVFQTASGAAASPAWTLHAIVQAVVGDEAMDLIDAYHARSPAARWSDAEAAEPAARMSAQAHAHAHRTFQRHRHDPGDGTVIALGERDAAPDAPGGHAGLDAGNAFPVPAEGLGLFGRPRGAPLVWSAGPLTTWRDHVAAPLDKPPRA